MTIPYIMGRDSITVMCAGVTHTIQQDHVNYTALKDAIRAQNWDLVPDLVTPTKAMHNFVSATQGRIEIVNGEVCYDGTPVHNAVSDRILEFVRDGFDAQPLMKFLEKLMSNPSRTAVTELYDWLSGTQLPITEDGDFIAYKKVRDDYFDFHTGKVLNKPAALMTSAELAQMPHTVNGVKTEVLDGFTVLSMPRNQVDDNRNRTCSQGLHFCSLSYLPSYHGGRGRVLLVRINPADVVSIPSDYDFAKGRAWRYTILSEHDQGERTEAFDTSVVTAKGELIKSAVTQTGDKSTQVLGVDFGSTARANQVQDLVDSCAGRNTTNYFSADEARVHGFDDAWDDLQPSLVRFEGGIMRDAVTYAQAYYEGYDRCRGKTGSTVTPVVTTTPPVAKTMPGNPSLVGYNTGRSHAARGVAYDTTNVHFQGPEHTKYAHAYHKGYNSVK